jgi:hypothetical protein
MNFAHYYNILQQIEKPIFVFDKFERENFIIYLKELEDYLTEQGADAGIKRKIFNVAVELLQQKSHNQFAYADYYHCVNFYENDNSYLFYTVLLYDNKYYQEVVRASTIIESRNQDGMKLLYKDFIRDNKIPFSFLGLIDMTRMGSNRCYFNITTTEKDYFTLEIIAVIHKIIA